VNDVARASLLSAGARDAIVAGKASNARRDGLGNRRGNRPRHDLGGRHLGARHL